MKRTGSIASYVGPAVTKTFLPFKGSLARISFSIKETISSGSAILPSPIKPLASSPEVAGIKILLKLCNLFKLSIEDGCLYISKSIAGAK